MLRAEPSHDELGRKIGSTPSEDPNMHRAHAAHPKCGWKRTDTQDPSARLGVDEAGPLMEPRSARREGASPERRPLAQLRQFEMDLGKVEGVRARKCVDLLVAALRIGV